MSLRFLVCLLFSSIVTCQASDRSEHGNSAATPLVRIFALPEKYDGKRVFTIGVLRVTWEGTGNGPVIRLYADEGHARNETYYDWVFLGAPMVVEIAGQNIIKVPSKEEILKLDMRYVVVEGQFFDLSEKGSTRLFPYRNVGAIDHLTILRPVVRMEWSKDSNGKDTLEAQGNTKGQPQQQSQ